MKATKTMESIPRPFPATAPVSTPTAPTSPAAPYIGGKRNLAARIIAHQRSIPHTTYVEVFVGMGGVFLRRPWRSQAEVVNDISTDVANLFRVVQRHYEALMDMLRWQLTSRAEFERLRAADPDTLTDLERAARFLYLQRAAYGGKVTHRAFGVSPGAPGRFDVTKLAPMLADIHDRLAGVVIERLPYAELLARYDRPETLFYLDPPYWGSEGDYGPVFGRDDFERLAQLLARAKGRWLMSINDTPGIRTLFPDAIIDEAEVTYTISGQPTRAKELVLAGGGGQGIPKPPLRRP